MTKPKLPIYTDRLQHGHEEPLVGSYSPEFFEIPYGKTQDEDLLHISPIAIHARFYLAGDYVIGNVSATMTLSLRCATCADIFSRELALEHSIIEAPLKEIKSNTWDVLEPIREEILLQLPLYPLCGGGVCKNRKEVSKYFTQDTKEDHFQPFKDLPDFE